MPKLLILPGFDNADKGDGGIRRVVEAQKRYLPKYGYEILSSKGLDPRIVAEHADLVALHGGAWLDVDRPKVNHCHGLYWQEYEWPVWAHEMNKEVVASIRQCEASTSPSNWVSRILARGMMIDSKVLYHGIEPKEWKAGNKSGYALWNKTRPDPICDVEPIGVLARMAPDVPFISTYAPTQAVANITTTGKLSYDRAKGYIQDASVYLCNTRETFGIGTLEAMASETPILGWNWGGQREIVEHKVTGWLARPGDYESLHEGLVYCLLHRERLGRAARAHVLKYFTWANAIKAYAGLYDNVLRDWQQSRTAPRVSVVITCYNLGDLLPRAVASVQRQTSDDWEIIIVDDKSTDNSFRVATDISAGDRRIRAIQNSENLYLAGALNAGIRASRGRFIIPLDADNELGDNAIEVLAGHLDAHRDVDIAYGRMEVVEEDGKRWVSDWPPNSFDYKRQISHRNQLPSTSMYRKSVWERVGGYRRRCRTAEDADFWCRATSFGAVPAKATDAVTLIYYNRGDSMSHVQRDWAWHAWYPWKDGGEPFGAAREWKGETAIPSYEPVKITVIIPVGPGHEELVVDAVDSLVAQTYQNWDCIVINDTGKPLPWIHPFVRVITTDGSKGPAVARNLGIAASNTPLWLPLDADDFLQPEALEALYKAWEPGTYVYTDWIVHETGEVKQSFDFDCQALLQKLPHAVTALYEREAWSVAGGFDEKLSAWEDWDFVINIASNGYCGVRLAQPLFHYRMAAGSRREMHYAGKDEYKKEIAAKWHKYIVDGEPMPCGGCGKNRVVFAPMNSSGAAVQTRAEPSNELVLVEFIGSEGNGARTYRGKSGQSYRFGADPEHKMGYVRAIDAAELLIRSEFRRSDNVVAVTEPLKAEGPPKRRKDTVSGQLLGTGDGDNVLVKTG